MADVIQNVRSLTSKPLQAAIEYAITKKQPVFIHGTMGIGKSSIVKQIAKKLKRQFIDIRLSQIDQTDLRGMPYFNPDDKLMHWAPPMELPNDPSSNAIIFLDEMNAAPPSVLAAAYQLILDRRVGTYTLPDNVVVIAAGNKSTDNGVTFKMPAPLANRFIHFELGLDYESWRDWAIDNRMNAQVIGYLEDNRQDLFTYSPKSPDEKAFATPRTWEFVSNLLDDNVPSEGLMTDMISSAIGQTLAIKFIAHRNRTFNLPKPMDILTGKEKEKLGTNDPSALYSLVTSLCYTLKDESDNKNPLVKEYADTFLNYLMDNMATEFCVIGVRTALKSFRIDLDVSMPGFKRFTKKHSAILTEIYRTK